MNSTHNIVETDKAWQKLHSRLQADGLIVEQSSARLHFGVLKYAAALIIVSAFLFITLYQNNHTSISNIDPHSSLVTQLKDGSTIYLHNNSTIKYRESFGKNNRVVELVGNAHFNVAKQEKNTFTIKTNQFVIEVLGTSFDVLTNDNINQQVIVHSGVVKITLIDSNISHILTKGDIASITNGQIETKKHNTLDIIESNSIHFKEMTLNEIISIINQKMGYTAFEIDEKISGREITATILLDSNIESIARSISTALNVNYIQNSNGVILIYD